MYTYGTGTQANYSGRPLVYPNQVPFDTDLLRESQYRMVDIAMLSQAVLGLPPTVGGSYSGFASGNCAQNGSPNMTVNIGTCSLYILQQMEPIAYGNLGPLTTPQLFKQAINMIAFNSSSLSGGTFVAPSSGNWQYYLIQGQFQTVQVNTVNRPYYNSANPASPNFGNNFDTEIDNIVFSVVQGAASSKTGSLPALPTVSANNVGMFLILVSDTTTTVTNSLISFYPFNFIGTTLPQMPAAIQNQNFSYSADSSASANAVVVAPNPPALAYTAGMRLAAKIANTNTGASTLNVSGLGTQSIILNNGSTLTGGELKAGYIAEFTYDGTNFELLNPSTVTAGFSNPGYVKLPGGFIIQWGITSGVASQAAVLVTFPIAFPNACLSASITPFSSVGNFTAGAALNANPTTTTMSISNQGTTSYGLGWQAYGY